MNLVKEFLLLKAKVDKLYCQLIAKGPDEQDPTVPNHVKTIKQDDIDNWNKVEDIEVQITENTNFAQIGDNQKDFNKSVSNYKIDSDLKNQEQDNRLSDIEGKNIAQDDLINNLSSEIAYENVRNDSQDNRLESLEEDLAAKLDKGTYAGTAQDLKNSIDSKQKKLSSFDESILIETDGNVEGNVSLFTEYFNQQVCELNFTPIQIIGIYVNGIKQRPSSYVITLPKTITIINFTSGDYIEIQYTKLKI